MNSWVKRGVTNAALAAAWASVPVVANAAKLVCTGAEVTSAKWRGQNWNTHDDTCAQ